MKQHTQERLMAKMTENINHLNYEVQDVVAELAAVKLIMNRIATDLEAVQSQRRTAKYLHERLDKHGSSLNQLWKAHNQSAGHIEALLGWYNDIDEDVECACETPEPLASFMEAMDHPPTSFLARCGDLCDQEITGKTTFGDVLDALNIAYDVPDDMDNEPTDHPLYGMIQRWGTWPRIDEAEAAIDEIIENAVDFGEDDILPYFKYTDYLRAVIDLIDLSDANVETLSASTGLIAIRVFDQESANILSKELSQLSTSEAKGVANPEAIPLAFVTTSMLPAPA